MKVLIVEDDRVTAKLLSDSACRNHSVISTQDGVEAIALFAQAFEEKEPFDLVLLDLELPSADGLEVLSELRKKELSSPHNPHKSKIIVISGHSEPSVFADIHALGCDGYVNKPINLKKLTQLTGL